jgi:hypothetical protein
MQLKRLSEGILGSGMMDSGSSINSTATSNGRYALTDATPERTIPYPYSYGWYSRDQPRIAVASY